MGYSYKDSNLSIVTNHALKCTASKLPINKEPVKVGIDNRIIANKVKYSDNSNIIITKPIMDRLVVRFDIKKHINAITDHCHETYDDIVAGINSYLVTSAKDETETIYQSVSVKEIMSDKTRFRGYKNNIWLIHPKTESRILVQTTPSGKGSATKPFIRLDFNPHDLGKSGIAFLKSEFHLMMGGNMSWEYMSQFKGTIQRMDIAVDFIGVDPSYMWVHRDKVSNQKHDAKFNIIQSDTGRNETLYYNYKQGVPTNTYLYNKKKEQLDKLGESEYKDALHSRFETRIETILPLDGLLGLKNPLKKFKIHAVDFDMLAGLHYTHVLVAEKALVRGIDKAVEVIPDNEKDQYIQSYDDATIKLWDHKQLWSHWPDLLKSYGLAE